MARFHLRLSSAEPCVRVTMSDAMRPRVKYVIGPDGSPLTIADLPPTSTKRWVIRRKAEVVAAVRGGVFLPVGSLHPLYADDRGIPVLAILDRPARPRRFAHDAHSAIPAISQSSAF